MGLTPVVAQGFLGWPTSALPLRWASDVIDGAIGLCESIGVPYAGGHTIDTIEPIFGMCVTGLGDATHVKRNNTARPGDVLYLTKPLGSGVLATAQKKGLLSDDDFRESFFHIGRPNTIGRMLGPLNFVSALTDITGFGLVGHLIEITEPSKTMAEIQAENIKLFPCVHKYLQKGCETSGGERNRRDFSSRAEIAHEPWQALAFDPQTNGGLLISCDPNHAGELESLLRAEGLSDHSLPIGVLRASSGPVRVMLV